MGGIPPVDQMAPPAPDRMATSVAAPVHRTLGRKLRRATARFRRRLLRAHVPTLLREGSAWTSLMVVRDRLPGPLADAAGVDPGSALVVVGSAAAAVDAPVVREAAWVLTSAAQGQRRDVELADSAAEQAKQALKDLNALREGVASRQVSEQETLSRRLRWRGGRTTFGTARRRSGSTLECRRPRSRAGSGTASLSSCGSTRTASTASGTRSTSGSRTRWASMGH